MTSNLKPPPAETANEDFGSRMLNMISGYWVTQIVHGAARYSLADHLHAGPMSAEQIAASEGLNPEATLRFLRACASLRLVSHDGGSRFSTTPLLDTLRSGNPQSLKGFAIALGAPGHWLPWGRFAEVMKTGETQTGATLGSGLFDYFASRPAEADAFTEAMDGMTAVVSQDAATAMDLTGVSCAADIGGAGGAFLFALMMANAHLRGIVFDLPNVVASAEKAAAEAGLQDRLKVVGGNFFVSVPAADIYLLKHVLHDWDDESCVTILRNCRRAMTPGGRVAVIEMLLGDVGEPGLAPLLDVNMMVLTRGRERTFAEYRVLFDAAGLGDVMVTPTNTPMSILEARAA